MKVELELYFLIIITLTETLFLILERGQGLDRPAVGLRHTIWIHTICVVCGSHHAASYCLGHCNLSIEEDLSLRLSLQKISIKIFASITNL